MVSIEHFKKAFLDCTAESNLHGPDGNQGGFSNPTDRLSRQGRRQGISIDSDVREVRFLQSWFESADSEMEPARGPIARELLNLADRLKRRLDSAPQDDAGRPLLTGNIRWKTTHKGIIEEIDPFAKRGEWTKVSADYPDAGKRARKAKVTINATLPPAGVIVGTTEIPHATLRVGKTTKRANANGEARFWLSHGWHVCVASAEGYQESAMPFLVFDNLGMDVPLFPIGGPTWHTEPYDDQRPSLTLVVRSGREIIKGATVRVGKISATTTTAGLATFPIEPGSYSYEVSAPGYEPEAGRFDIPGEPWVYRGIELSPSKAGLKSEVTVRVKSGIDNHRIESAEIMFGSDFKLTDGDGEATFDAVTQQKYEYTVAFDMERFALEKGTFEVRRSKEVLEFVLQPARPDSEAGRPGKQALTPSGI